ncbi:MAG: alginate export family protein, partial [Gammaproteobacteria bacterium]|nr:alginate export family protein [Gammaproteobacteria bacterium]
MSLPAAKSHASDLGSLSGDFRLRYENVRQDNALKDATAITLRSRLTFVSDDYKGFSALLEVEDVRELKDDFSVPPAGIRAGQYSVIADPQGTELDQALLQYANEKLTVKLGRQVLTLDGHRFVGHVGWRQDRQTFDGVVAQYKPIENFVINATYIDKRNRIFAEQADVDSRDTLLNTAYNTAFGKFVAYAYLLETDNARNNSLDTFGVRFAGAKTVADYHWRYAAEFATQQANNIFDTDYLQIEAALAVRGVSAKIAFEQLG